jgi:hypothetical protein
MRSWAFALVVVGGVACDGTAIQPGTYLSPPTTCSGLCRGNSSSLACQAACSARGFLELRDDGSFTEGVLVEVGETRETIWSAPGTQWQAKDGLLDLRAGDRRRSLVCRQRGKDLLVGEVRVVWSSKRGD